VEDRYLVEASRRPTLLAVALVLSLLTACATPVGVERLDAQTVHRELTSNVLSTGELSRFSDNVLRQYALETLVAEDAATALAELHAAVAADPSPDVLFALAELSFWHAERGGGQPHYLASAVYAFEYLFPEGGGTPPSPFDPRFRWAADIYNRALTEGLASADRGEFEPRSGFYRLPFGKLEIAFDQADLLWDGRRLTGFVPVAEFRVRGLRNRYRQAGLGAPLAASTSPLQPREGFQVGQRVKVPITAILSLQDARRRLASGHVIARLDLYTPTDAASVAIAGQEVPIEVEPSAALAHTLSDPELWAVEIRGFFAGGSLGELPTRLAATEPYRPGRFPVIFVHGTASSAGRWANMVNDLKNDPLIGSLFQFWFFTYETGNPIPYSALVLRNALTEAVDDLDPDADDPALREMVVIGHSQGGLLAKMTVIHTGSRLYDHLASKPLEDLRVDRETRALVRNALFVEPAPYVRRVVFLSTPHRGSYLAERSISRLIGRLVRLPVDLATTTSGLLTANADALRFDPRGIRLGSLYGMTPGSPLITGLAEISMVPEVAAHSIIAVKGNGPPELGSDGVVRYQSAHIEGVESELIVRSGHSSQSNPHTIAEIRRILLLHAAKACARNGTGCPDDTVATRFP
jgi:pimeloyl-ACP methyl ester carboxylesterase